MITLENLKAIKTAMQNLTDTLALYPEEAKAVGFPNPQNYWRKWRDNSYQPAKDLVDNRTLADIEAARLEATLLEAHKRLELAKEESDIMYYQTVIDLLKKNG